MLSAWELQDPDVAEKSFSEFSIQNKPWDEWTCIPVWELVCNVTVSCAANILWGCRSATSACV